MNKYKADIEFAIKQRQIKIDNEKQRLADLDNQIESTQRQHKAELKQQTDAFLADYRNKKQILEGEIMEAKQLRDRN